MERSMSVTIGGTAPNPCRRGGSWSLDAGSGAIVAVFSMWNLPSSRHQVQIEPSRFVVSTTTPRNPYSRTGSCAGRTSSAIWWLAPRSMVWTLRRARRSQKWIRCPYLFESRSSGTIPFSNRRLGGIGLGIHDINPRGAESGDDQIAPFEKGVAGKRRQRGRAGVPAKMVELVASVRHRHRVDNLAERGRAGLYIDHCEGVGL